MSFASNCCGLIMLTKLVKGWQESETICVSTGHASFIMTTMGILFYSVECLNAKLIILKFYDRQGVWSRDVNKAEVMTWWPSS